MAHDTPVFTIDQVQWVLDQIARNGLRPAAPGNLWPGQKELATRIRQKFALKNIQQAMGLVEMAQDQIWAEQPDDPARVEKRLLIARLSHYRQIVLNWIERPRKTFKYELRPKKTRTGEPVMRRRPKIGMQQVYARIPVSVEMDNREKPQLIKLLLALERMIIGLQHLQDEHSQSLRFHEMANMLDPTLLPEKDSAGKKITSITQVVQTIENFQQFGDAGRRVIEQAKAEELGRAKASETSDARHPPALPAPEPTDPAVA